MNEERIKRSLKAIISADVAGYSRLMGQDEVGTISRLKEYRQVMESNIQRFGGRVIDFPGDNLLAEFASVVDAVECAVDIQGKLKIRNQKLPDDKQMQFRIGINLGDVIEDEGRIYGDGVNIAARLESLAESGGICISGVAYTHVKNKLKLEYEFLGKQTVKNISEPVPVYCIKSVQKTSIEYSVDQAPISILSNKPSVAVLPFVNMSKDPDQEYFSDGMAEEIIGALAKLEGLKVISRTSAFYFKSKDVDLRTIGEKLKVDHVLEGSVRKAGNRVRISAQLIKVADDTHLWADTYDRQLEDVFAIQDEISQAVVESLKVKLLGGVAEPLVKDYTHSTEAYELFLKALHFLNKGEIKKSIGYLEKTIQIDPSYVPAYAYLAHNYYDAMMRWGMPPWEMIPKINSLVQKAANINEAYGFTYTVMALMCMLEFDWSKAEKDFKRATELTPNLCATHGGYSFYLGSVGRIDEAILEARKAVELDPLASFDHCFLSIWLTCDGQFEKAIMISNEILELDPNNALGLMGLGYAYAGNGKYDKAISVYHKLRDVPGWRAYLGFFYGKSGNKGEAQKILNGFLEQNEAGYCPPSHIARVYSGLGDYDKAFEWLDRAYGVQDPSGGIIKIDITFSDLHSDPRWQDVLKKRNLAD